MDEISKIFHEKINEFFGEYSIPKDYTDKPTDTYNFLIRLQPIWDDLSFGSYNTQYKGISSVEEIEKGKIEISSSKKSLVFQPKELYLPKKNNSKDDLLAATILTQGMKTGLEERLIYNNKDHTYINGTNMIAIYPSIPHGETLERKKILILEKLNEHKVDFDINELKKDIPLRYIPDKDLPLFKTKDNEYLRRIKENPEYTKVMRNIFRNSEFIIHKENNVIFVLLEDKIDQKKLKKICKEFEKKHPESVFYVEKDTIEVLDLGDYYIETT